MAILIKSTPPTYSSVHGDLIYTVSETAHTADPLSYPNYKFIADVYIGATLICRLRRVPNPVTKIGIFNVGQSIRNYLATSFNPAPLQVLAQEMTTGDFNLKVTVKFGEEYAYTSYYALVTDTQRVFYNTYNAINYEPILAGKVNRAATDRPAVTDIMRGCQFNFVPFFTTGTTDVVVRIKSYNYSNVRIHAENLAITPTAANNLMVFNLSPAAINAFMDGLVDDNTKYFTIELDGTGVDMLYQFNLVCEPIYEAFNVHFLNKYGGFESKLFNKVSRKTVEIEKKSFGKLAYVVDSSGQVSYKNSNGVYNESKSVYASQYNQKLLVNSDIMADDEYTWLEQLVLSPMVYIENAGEFYPVSIIETNYEPKKFVNDELTNLTLTFDYGVQLNAQFR